ncbi:MAG: hypothetical protein Q4B43_11300 [Bacteroidota bacterium]|nr:hypothetical protein [Bacteroidota bacterium]
MLIKICKLIFVTSFLFLIGYLWSFYYYLEKDALWEIRIGFPFPHFGYHFMGNGCQDFYGVMGVVQEKRVN